MKCPVCGSDIKSGSKYCDTCGSDLAARTRRAGAHAAERLPYDPHVKVDEKDIQRSAVAELKETKAAYKEARRNAGKTNTPKIIAIIVAMIVVAGASAVATWYFVNNRAEAEITALQAKVEQAQEETKTAQSEVEAAQKQVEELEEKLTQYEKALAEEAVENASSREEKDDSSSTSESETTVEPEVVTMIDEENETSLPVESENSAGGANSSGNTEDSA